MEEQKQDDDDDDEEEEEEMISRNRETGVGTAVREWARQAKAA